MLPVSKLEQQPIILVAALLLAALIGPFIGVNCQLPGDIERELNQNLAEQARIQALQQRQQQLQKQQQQQQQNRLGSRAGPSSGSQPAKHDPNNFSYQQVSPPVQYSYYQPFGDAAANPAAEPATGQQPQQASRRQSTQPMNFDLNNLNFDMPQPQAQVSSAAAPRAGPLTQYQGQPQQQQQHYTPSFTGAGGLPVLKPIAASSASNSFEPAAVPVGAAPLAPQARVQQGPPLTEADFKDITGGENYGAPGGNDFGLGDATSASASGQPRSRSSDADDAQLREFGLPAEPQQQQQQPAAHQDRRIDSAAGGMNIPDFGGFNPIGVGQQQQQQQQQQPRADNNNNDFGTDFGNLGSGSGTGNNAGGNQAPSGEFDFAGQPSSRQTGGVDQAASTPNGGAPGSLQSLLGSGFPGLGGAQGNSNSGLDNFAKSNNDPQASNQRQDDGAMDVADMGEKSDGFSGADLGGFEQPNPQNDKDFNFGGVGAAASNQQPKSVPYPDSNPQPVGTLWALTQPQSLTQTRYNALPDKGTYQDYPAYASGGNDFSAVSSVVNETPSPRRTGPGRYGTPSSHTLAPEVRQSLSAGQQYNYAREPASVWINQQQQQQAGSDKAGEFDFPLE